MHRSFTALLALTALTALTILSPAHAADAPKAAQVAQLLTQPLPDLANKEAIVLTVEYAPGQSSPSHRHNAHTFVYVLEGAIMMGVKGKDPVRLEAGQTFYESPSDIHAVSANASTTAPAKFVVFMVKEKGAPVTVPAP